MSTPVVLTPYEELEPFTQNENHIENLKAVNSLLKETKETQWEEHIKGIDLLRRLYKYERTFMFTLINDLQLEEVIGSFMTSIRTARAKASIQFVKELFSQYEFEFNANNKPIQLVYLVGFFIPKILKAACSDKGFLREEANKCLTEISNNMFYGKTILVLLRECMDKNQKQVDIAFNTLVNLLNNLERNYLNYYTHWDQIFSGLVNIYSIKKDFYQKKVGKIILLFEELISKERYGEILRNYCKEEDQKILAQAMTYYKTKVLDKGLASTTNTTSKTIKDFIKASKGKQTLKGEINIEIL